MRSEQEKIHAIEVRSVYLGRGGEVEHGVEIDGRLGIRTLAHQSGPHRIVESGKIVQRHYGFFRSGSASGLPGPKCFKITNGSVAL